MTITKTPYWMRQTLSDLVRHEGFREFAYPDPLSPLFKKYRKERWGYVMAETILAKLGISYADAVKMGAPWTVGIGFTNGVTPKTRMTLEFAMRKLEHEVLDHLWVLDKAVPGWLDMPDVVKTVLANLAFNLGNRLLQFKTTLRMIKAGNYAAAGTNLQSSLWYKQVGGRAVELTTRLKTGKIAPKHRVD